MKELNKSGLVSAATCLLKAAEALDEVSRIKIVGAPQYGRPVAGDAKFKSAIRLYTQAAAKYRAAGARYAEAEFVKGARAEKSAKALFAAAEREYEAGYKACTGE